MKWTRILLWALGIAVVLFVAGLGIGALWLNSFIHSDAFRHEVEDRAGKTLGATIEIKQIHFNAWSGIELSGLATKMVTPQGTVVTQVTSIDCGYSFNALLHRQLHIDGITVVEPQIVLTQVAPSSVPTPAPPTVPLKGNPTLAQIQSGKTGPFTVTLQAAKIKDGTLSIQDAAGTNQAQLQGLQATTDTSGFFEGKDVTGELTVAKVVLPQNITAADFSTSFRYRTDFFEASAFKVSSFGGQITGSYKLEGTAPSVMQVNIAGLDLAAAGQAVMPDLPTKLSGALALQSTWSAVETGQLNGEGDAQIANGKLAGQPLMQELAKAFHVEEMAEPDIQSITVHLRVKKGVTQFSDLQLKSTTFDMAGRGTIDPQGNLTASMSLILHPDTMKRIPPLTVHFFQVASDGSGTIPFQLSGQALNPTSDNLTHLFIEGSKVQEKVKNTFKKLFH